ncbi:hypothetical protein DEO72_LG7g1639 [Vigna unguiculata]|uniref:Uncharacterized protein n=1 Tax=Vigna unguiculata TaxID=3917 RepID=A0A4D6MJH3_VIGUN|nr:hypothetical protein DEO72_LG7g1639 [Vigna unguiculata]
MSMRGIGGPLLCIGDLLNDVGEEQQGHSLRHEAFPTLFSSNLNDNDPPPHLPTLFQEHYDHLNSALSGTDHSWTSLTLRDEGCNKNRGKDEGSSKIRGNNEGCSEKQRQR